MQWRSLLLMARLQKQAVLQLKNGPLSSETIQMLYCLFWRKKVTHISKLTLPKGNQPFLKVICEERFSNFTIFHNKNYYVLLSVSKVGQYKIERIINNHSKV